MAVRLLQLYEARLKGFKYQVNRNLNDMRDLIDSEINKSLDVLYPRASRSGEAPRKRTGRLQRSTRVVLDLGRKTIEIGNVAPYAEPLIASGRVWSRTTLERIKPRLDRLRNRGFPWGLLG